ncbi:hypothetical protein [Acidovorax temperans]|uniref:hypothetical protein n=1 Tax=uncultured Acidovorax sp. TaxID=158751 RepID=UPI002B55F16B|nr:hypothetical protein [Acidovorax temperans]
MLLNILQFAVFCCTIFMTVFMALKAGFVQLSGPESALLQAQRPGTTHGVVTAKAQGRFPQTPFKEQA